MAHIFFPRAKIPLSFLWLIKKSLARPRTILDVGCGNGILMQELSRGESWEITGIDIFKNQIDKAKRLDIYKKIIKGDAITETKKLIQSKKKFDVVFCSQLIEHLSKKSGLLLLDYMDRISVHALIVTTPNGYMLQKAIYIGCNPHQHHKSGWTVEDFEKRGFKVYGLGLRLAWSDNGWARSDHKARSVVANILSYLCSPIVYLYPNLGAGILAVKDKER